MTPGERSLIASDSSPEKELRLWIHNADDADGAVEYEMVLNGVFIMASNHSSTEESLVRRAAELSNAVNGDILIGGLGMGYSVKEACALDNQPSSIDVVELDPVIIDWNMTLIAANREYLTDKRVRIIQDDFVDYIEKVKKKYHMVCMDIDNGPALMVYEKNARAYTVAFFERVRKALRKGGVFAVWSGNQVKQLFDDMSAVFRDCSVEEAIQDIQGKRISYYLYFGVK